MGDDVYQTVGTGHGLGRKVYFGDFGDFGDFGVSFAATVAGRYTRWGGPRHSVQGEPLVLVSRLRFLSPNCADAGTMRYRLWGFWGEGPCFFSTFFFSPFRQLDTVGSRFVGCLSSVSFGRTRKKYN